MASLNKASIKAGKNKVKAEKRDLAIKREVVQKPDIKLYDAKIAEERKSIEEIKAKLNELRVKIDSNTSGREEFNRKQIEIRSRLNKLQEKADQLEKERKDLFDKIDNKNKEGKEMRQNVLNLKKSIGFSSEDDIDKKINEIESIMITSTISLREEKKLMQQIAMLKSNKPLIGKYASMETRAHKFEDDSILPLRDRLAKLKEELNLLRNDRREESEKYRNLMNKKNDEIRFVKHFFDEKNELTKQLAVHNENLRNLQNEMSKELDKYKEYMNYLSTLKSKQYEEERRKRAIDNECSMLLRELEKAVEVDVDENSVLLQQTILYVQKLMKEENVGVKSSNDDNKNNDFLNNNNNKDDGLAVLPKKDRKEEFLIAPKSKKVNRKVGNSKQKEKTRFLKLEIGVLSIFEQCGVDPPISVDDLEKCLNDLTEKYEEIQKRQKKKIDESNEKVKLIQSQLDALNIKASTEKIANLNSKNS